MDLIRRFQTNYENSSDTTPALTVSYQKLITHYGDNRHQLAAEVKRELSTLFNRVFGNRASINIQTSTEDAHVDYNTYNVIISVTLTMNGIFYSVSPTIKMHNGIPVIENDKVTKIPLSTIEQDS